MHGLSCSATCGILVTRPGNQPCIPRIAGWTLNHWTTKEVPDCLPSNCLLRLEVSYKLLLLNREYWLRWSRKEERGTRKRCFKKGWGHWRSATREKESLRTASSLTGINRVCFRPWGWTWDPERVAEPASTYPLSRHQPFWGGASCSKQVMVWRVWWDLNGSPVWPELSVSPVSRTPAPSLYPSSTHTQMLNN